MPCGWSQVTSNARYLKHKHNATHAYAISTLMQDEFCKLTVFENGFRMSDINSNNWKTIWMNSKAISHLVSLLFSILYIYLPLARYLTCEDRHHTFNSEWTYSLILKPCSLKLLREFHSLFPIQSYERLKFSTRYNNWNKRNFLHVWIYTLTIAIYKLNNF